ncbi:MAG: baseplate J/gp47 family protein [Anaerolineae bacterium]|nr:baseplate J/gp47 family protein [Anaerolineae bacterium]
MNQTERLRVNRRQRAQTLRVSETLKVSLRPDAARASAAMVVGVDSGVGVVEAVRQVVYADTSVVILTLAEPCAWHEADLELLARRAAGVNRAVALITSNGRLRKMAQTVGLAVFHTQAEPERGAAKAVGWPRQTRRRLDTLKRPPNPPDLTVPWPITRRQRQLARLGVGSLTLFALLALLGLGVAAAPSSVITLRPETRTIATSFEAQARAGASLDAERGIIPARSLDITVETHGEATPSGVQIEADGRATGTVQFINRRAEQAPIPYGALVETSGGTRVRFRTTQPAVVRGEVGATVSVPIVAVEPGPGGNVPSYAINALEPALAFFMGVVNDGPTAGGSMRQQAVVTDTDREMLRQDLEARLSQEATAGLRAQLAAGERLARESVQVAVVGERWDSDRARPDYAGLTLRLRARGLGYDPQQADALAKVALNRAAPSDFRLLSETTSFTTTESERVVWEGDQPIVWVGVRGQGQARARVDRQAVQHAVRGMTPADASRAVGALTHLAEPAWVTLNGPAWVTQRWGRLPWLPLRIDVVVLD